MRQNPRPESSVGESCVGRERDGGEASHRAYARACNHVDEYGRASRRRGEEKRSPLPDFYIGAHAAVAGYRLLMRDAGLRNPIGQLSRDRAVRGIRSSCPTNGTKKEKVDHFCPPESFPAAVDRHAGHRTLSTTTGTSRAVTVPMFRSRTLLLPTSRRPPARVLTSRFHAASTRHRSALGRRRRGRLAPPAVEHLLVEGDPRAGCRSRRVHIAGEYRSANKAE